MYTSQCGGLHGRLKVATDGTVFVPNNNCGGTGAVVVSADNGLTWAIRTVPGTVSNPNLQDPAVAVDNAGRAYFIISRATRTGSQAIVPISTDPGQTSPNTLAVGVGYGLSTI